MRQESKLAKLCVNHATQGLALFHGLYLRQASLYPVFLSAPTWKRLPQPSWAFLKYAPYAPFFDPTDEYVGFNKACLQLRQGTLPASIPAKQIAWLPKPSQMSLYSGG